MKSISTKKKSQICKAINRALVAFEKCGGAGGTPGPCPTGGGGKPAGGKPLDPKKKREIFTSLDHWAATATTGGAGWGGSGYLRERIQREHGVSARHAREAHIEWADKREGKKT